MAPLSVFLSASPADSEFAQRLAQVIAATGTPVVTELPTVGQGPGPDESKAPALVLVLSTAALIPPAQGAAVQLYGALLQADPSIPVIPVLLDPLPADAVPPALGGFQPVTAPYGMPGFHEALIDGVLQRLGLAQQPGALTPVLPLSLPIGPESMPGSPAFDGAAADTSAADASVADEGALGAPLELATTSVVPVPVLPVPEMPTMPMMPAMVTPAVVPPVVVPPVPPRALTWRQRIERNRRPIAIGVAASIALLLIACVAFSLGVGSPGNGAADRLDSGVPGGSNAAAATATDTATASPAPTASATRAKGTATAIHATPTGTHTATTTTPTAALPTPTPTLGPGTGLHGDYFHSKTYRPGTPVPYPDSIFGAPWFSTTDTIIDMGYGPQRYTYTPPLAPFDSPVCPSPPTSSPCSPFAVRWTGFVRPRYTETYTFTTDSDDGVKLWINGQLIVDNWQIQGDTPASGTINLTADQLASITVEYYENGEGPATMVLQWQSASQPLEVIPQSQLYLPG